MLEDKIKATMGELLLGNLALQQKNEELQAQLDVANAKLAKTEPAVPDGGKGATP